MARLIHLNGPPGIGKSTIARRYAADHPGVLVCDNDVLLPQLLLDPAELARFEGAAARAHASFVERFLLDDPARAAERFGRRGEADPDDPWHEQVRDIVADQGGAEALREWAARLAALAAARPGAVVVPSLE